MPYSYVPPVGGAPLDLGGTTGDPRLDLGAREVATNPELVVAARTAGASATVACTISAPSVAAAVSARTGGARASISASVGPSLAVSARTAGASAAVSAQIGQPLSISARTASPSSAIACGVSPRGNLLLVSARTASPSAAISLSKNAGLVGHSCGPARARWSQGAKAGAAAVDAVADARRSQSVASAGWCAADLAPGWKSTAWRDAVRANGCGSAAWSRADRSVVSDSASWRDAPRSSGSARNVWRASRLRLRGERQDWRGLPRAVRDLSAGWNRSSTATRDLAVEFSDGVRVYSVEIERWRDAKWLGYVWRNRPPERPEPPWSPNWTARLCLGSGPYPAGSARLDLGWACRPPTAIPARRSYTMLHRSRIWRLSDGEEVPHKSWSVALDADSWAWSWSATLVRSDALALVLPSALGEPVAVGAEIDGIVWHLLVEDWSEDLTFGSRAIKISGRGLTAELGAPYELPATGTLQQSRTTQQAVAERLPLDPAWSLVWWDGAARRMGGPARDPTPDWLLPAGSWTWDRQTPAQAISEALQSAGLVLVPSRTGRAITVQPRYPLLPWQFFDETPDLEIPLSAITKLARGLTLPSQANAVWVHGGSVGGVMVRGWLTGTAGDREAQTQSSDWLTDQAAGRVLAARLLAARAQQPAIRSITLPLGDGFPLAEIGDLVSVDDASGTVRGICCSVSVEVGLQVRQTVGIGEETSSLWARWKRLLPDSPLLVGTVGAFYADGTALVGYPGAGSQRVRGSATVGSKVWVRDGRIEGAAPTMDAFEVELF